MSVVPVMAVPTCAAIPPEVLVRLPKSSVVPVVSKNSPPDVPVVMLVAPVVVLVKVSPALARPSCRLPLSMRTAVAAFRLLPVVAPATVSVIPPAVLASVSNPRLSAVTRTAPPALAMPKVVAPVLVVVSVVPAVGVVTLIVLAVIPTAVAAPSVVPVTAPPAVMPTAPPLLVKLVKSSVVAAATVALPTALAVADWIAPLVLVRPRVPPAAVVCRSRLLPLMAMLPNAVAVSPVTASPAVSLMAPAVLVRL